MSVSSEASASWFFLLINTSLAAPGLRGCAWAFSRCREQGPLPRCGVQASRRGALLLQSAGLRACGLRWLWLTGLVAPRHVVPSWTRDGTGVPALQGGLLTGLPGKPYSVLSSSILFTFLTSYDSKQWKTILKYSCDVYYFEIWSVRRKYVLFTTFFPKNFLF